MVIGTTSPSTSLDVNGGVRAGSSSAVTTCGLGQANGEGAQRYNYSTHNMEYCNGTGWTALTTGTNCGAPYITWSGCSTGFSTPPFQRCTSYQICTPNCGCTSATGGNGIIMAAPGY